MPSRDAMGLVRLIAAREFVQTVRSVQFVVATVVTALIAITAYLVNAPSSPQAPAEFTVAVVSAAPDPRPVLPAAGQLPVRWSAVDDAGAAASDVAAGRADAAVLPDRVVAGPSVTPSMAALLETEREARASGGTSAGGAPAVPVQTVPGRSPPASAVVGYLVGFLIYYSITLIGQSVARGVVEERSSRTVEVLLATVRPWQLLTGKVAGLTLAGLVQVGALVVGVGAVLVGTRGTAVVAFVPGPLATVACLIWLALSVSVLGMVFGGVGATVDRQADLQSVLVPMLLGLAVLFFGGLAWYSAAPDDPWFEALSLVPPLSVITVPARLASGSIPGWQTLVAFLLLAGAGAVATAVSARLFTASVLQFGGPSTARALRRALRRG